MDCLVTTGVRDLARRAGMGTGRGDLRDRRRPRGPVEFARAKSSAKTRRRMAFRVCPWALRPVNARGRADSRHGMAAAMPGGRRSGRESRIRRNTQNGQPPRAHAQCQGGSLVETTK